jgi:hypothetical protein
MLGARLITAAAAQRKGHHQHARGAAASPASSSTSTPQQHAAPADDAAAAAAARGPRRRPSGSGSDAALHVTLPALPLPPDFADRLLVGFFGATVIGQLYTWPTAALLLAAGPGAVRALAASGRPLLAALVAAAAAALLLYLRHVLGRGFRLAEVTPSVAPGDRGTFWWQRAPIARWRQWARLRRFVGARLVRAGPPLDPARAYVFAGYPHGISAISAFANLVADPAGWADGDAEGDDDDDDDDASGGEQEAQSRRLDAAAAAAAAAAAPSPSRSPSPPAADAAATARHRGTFRTLFPGITMHAMTLASNFKAPLVREFCLGLGLRPATRTACAALLTRQAAAAIPACAAAAASPPSDDDAKGHRGPAAAAAAAAAEDAAAAAPPPLFGPAPGRAIFLAPGGAAEALLSRPGGSYDVLLARRKGFCRVALATGADVVPVLMFGETELFDVWHPSPGTLAWRLQRLSHRLFGTSQPVFRGEGLLGAHHWGLLPRRWSPRCGRPRLTTVVGPPVRNECAGGAWSAGGAAAPPWPPRIPKRGADPAFERAVDALHARYCVALRELFEAHKGRYHPGGRAELHAADGDGDGDGASSSSRMQH